LQEKQVMAFLKFTAGLATMMHCLYCKEHFLIYNWLYIHYYINRT